MVKCRWFLNETELNAWSESNPATGFFSPSCGFSSRYILIALSTTSWKCISSSLLNPVAFTSCLLCSTLYSKNSLALIPDPIPSTPYLRRGLKMQGTYDDSWSPRSSDYSCTSGSSSRGDADDELDDDMSQADSVGRDVGSATGSESGRASPSPSVYSYHSSVDGNVMLRDIHGRTFNNTSEVSRRWSLMCCKHRPLTVARTHAYKALYVACGRRGT